MDLIALAMLLLLSLLLRGHGFSGAIHCFSYTHTRIPCTFRESDIIRESNCVFLESKL